MRDRVSDTLGITNTAKRVHAVTSSKQSPILMVTFSLSCHKKFDIN